VNVVARIVLALIVLVMSVSVMVILAPIVLVIIVLVMIVHRQVSKNVLSMSKLLNLIVLLVDVSIMQYPLDLPF